MNQYSEQNWRLTAMGIVGCSAILSLLTVYYQEQ